MAKNTDTSMMTDEELLENAFSTPWQYEPTDRPYRDPDGFLNISSLIKEDSHGTRKALQEYCWNKFCQNPQVNTNVRGVVGRITGFGFEVSCDIQEIQDVLDEIEFDPRNRLWDNWRQYVGRSNIEGELFLCLTCHTDGFVEIDFIDPGVVDGGNDYGIIFHPKKPQMPLFYCISDKNGHSEQIPSINIARYPDLIEVAKEDPHFKPGEQKNSKNKKKVFKQFGGYYRFVINWDKGFVTKRNISHLRTVMQWLTHWEDLKKYEIDHKKSAGAYIWVVQFEDIKSWIQWLKLTDEQRAKTGIAAKKTPGGTMVLGPGMKMTAQNPNLPSISGTDTDILHMVTSGLNEPEDVTTGQSTGTFASVKASRGPMSDRISDEVAYFERFYRYDFWANIFFLKSKISNFPDHFNVKEAYDFTDADPPEPVFKKMKRKPERLIEVTFPTSETNDYEATARGLLGVKHGSTNKTLGIPNQLIAKKIGFGNYKKLRLQQATEDARFPPLMDYLDDEAMQESAEAEPKVAQKKKVDSKK